MLRHSGRDDGVTGDKRLDIMHADKAQLFWRDAGQRQGNGNITRRQRAGRCAERLVLHVHFLVIFGGAL